MQYELIIWGVVIGIIAFVIIISLVAFYLSRLVVVPPSEFHVVVTKDRRDIYDGKGRYLFFPTFKRRIIIPKRVLDIEVSQIRLHDKHNLPFMLEISCKIQVKDAQKAAESLGAIDEMHLKRITEDTVMSSARSICMQMEILTIMREREQVENAIYKLIVDSLMKLGLEPVIFDIKDISDAKESTVIKDFERVKSAELRKDARIAESIHLSEAEITESERHKMSQVKHEVDLMEEEQAKIQREMAVADQTKELVTKKMLIQEEEIKRSAEIQKQKITLDAQAAGEAVRIRAQAEAEATELKAHAEAAGIRDKAKALEEYQKAGEKGMKIKSLEILVDGMVKSSEHLATALETNSKIIMLGGNNQGQSGSGNLLNMIPMYTMLTESGLLSLLPEEMTPTSKKTKKEE
ncbi:MAG TPA: SPFH domain-containing protein [Candidatus Deferrimicrobium sp.]|nr:SPFH domain-containing protein [Candidatus Deferrimicrobium sp.]